MEKMKHLIWLVIRVIATLWFFLVVAAGIAWMFERDGDVYGMLSILATIIFVSIFIKKESI